MFRFFYWTRLALLALGLACLLLLASGAVDKTTGLSWRSAEQSLAEVGTDEVILCVTGQDLSNPLVLDMVYQGEVQRLVFWEGRRGMCGTVTVGEENMRPAELKVLPQASKTFLTSAWVIYWDVGWKTAKLVGKRGYWGVP